MPDTDRPDYAVRGDETILNSCDESTLLSKCAFDLANALGVSKLMVQASEVQNAEIFDSIRGFQDIIWLTRNASQLRVQVNDNDHVVELPEATFTRENQLKVGMLLAVLNEVISNDENIVCLSGIADSGRMDTLFVANARRDFPWFKNRTIHELQRLIATREFVSILGVALRLANEGREGRAIGTSFVLGDPEQLQPYLRQLVLNPCEGHPELSRDIHNPSFFETIREFASLDGAFVINNAGIVHSAGTYLNAPSTQRPLTLGLGARHAAARSITEITSAIALVVSSSSGTVSVFHEGQLVLELEKPDARYGKSRRSANRRSSVA